MSQLSLVKSLSHLQEEKRFAEEVVLESLGLSLARGTVTEITGSASSGRTSFALNLLARLTRDGEICAVVDLADSFDPRSATLAGVCLDNMLWVKCGGEIEKAFTSTDYLVQAKGFGAIWLNLGALPNQKLRMIPRTYWYRYRNRIKQTPTLFIVTAPDSVAGSASHQSFALARKQTVWSGIGRYKLLREFHLALQPKRQFYGTPAAAKIEFDYSDV